MLFSKNICYLWLTQIPQHIFLWNHLESFHSFFHCTPTPWMLAVHKTQFDTYFVGKEFFLKFSWQFSSGALDRACLIPCQWDSSSSIGSSLLRSISSLIHFAISLCGLPSVQVSGVLLSPFLTASNFRAILLDPNRLPHPPARSLIPQMSGLLVHAHRKDYCTFGGGRNVRCSSSPLEAEVRQVLP